MEGPGTMKFEISLKQMVEAVGVVARAISTRPQLPILSNVLIEAEKTRIKLTATDLELGIQVYLPAKVEEGGRVAIPARMLLDYLSAIGGEKVSFALEGQAVSVSSGEYGAKMAVMDVSEFPEVGANLAESGFEVSASALTSSLGKVLFASAKDALRPVLTGILFEVSGKKLKLVATDGFRLAMSSLTLANEARVSDKLSLLIPSRAASEILKLAGEKALSFDYVSENNQVVVRAEGVTILIQVLAGNYPDYTKILPKDFELSFSAMRDEVLQAVRSVSVFARDNSNVTRWRVSENELTIKGEAQERGSGSASCPVEISSGSELEVAFNGKYVAEFLNGISEDRIKVSLGASMLPGAFEIEGDSSYLYVVMPINI